MRPMHPPEPQAAAGSLRRRIDWTGAFWIASGVPALLLCSVEAVAATVGPLAGWVWLLSIGLGLLQAFTHAEIAGLFPTRAGGVAVHGALAWQRTSRLLPPLMVWCYWFAWSPVLAIGAGLAAGDALGVLLPPDAAIHTWQLVLLDLGRLRPGLMLRIDATFVLGTTLLLAVFGLQHGGIVRLARVCRVLALLALVPLLLLALLALLGEGLPGLPLRAGAGEGLGALRAGGGDPRAALTLLAGGLFIAAWSTYGFETVLVYTRELRRPRTDTVRALVAVALLSLLVFLLLPLALHGLPGLGEGPAAALPPAGAMAAATAAPGVAPAPALHRGTGLAQALAERAGGGVLLARLTVVLLILALLLALMTAMSGAARTLHQAALQGWMPRYLAQVNEHGVPTRAMGTQLGFNLLLLLMSDDVLVLACSNVGYLLFNFLALQAGWIHRLERPDWSRPYRAPRLLLALGALLGFLNLALMGLGADVYGAGTLTAGLLFALLILPVFVHRHWVQDRGVFPPEADDGLPTPPGRGWAGRLPALTLALGAAVLLLSHRLAQP